MHIKKKKDSAIKFSNISFIKTAMGNKKTNFRRHISFYLFLVILGLMIIGFSGPEIPLEKTQEGVNVVLTIDASGSMKAADYQPTRLEAAKKSAEILIENLHENDNAGIVIFESGATTSSYLSPYKDKVISKLKGIASKEGSTALGDGLALSVDMAISMPNKKRIVILLSDGVNNAGVISPQEAITYAKNNKVQVYTIGMGSDDKVVLGYDFFGNPQYAELDENTLKNIAEITNGKYFKSVNTDTLDEIYKTISSDIKREKEPTSIKEWFFIAAFLLIIIQVYIEYGKFRILK